MNAREFECSKILTDLVDNHGLVGIKTSFEDEGATFNETVRLKEICNQAKTKLILKIGGPEATRDIQDAEIIGVKGLVAPMIESSFALTKFISCLKSNLSTSNFQNVQFLINIETFNSYQEIDNILNNDNVQSLYGITLGRVDFSASINQDRSYVNSDDLLQIAKNIFTKAKEKKLSVCVGGAVTFDSYNFLSKLYKLGLLDKFETRYAIYDPSIALKDLKVALNKGQIFEYEWLKCKKDYYFKYYDKDTKRLEMIQERINSMYHE